LKSINLGIEWKFRDPIEKEQNIMMDQLQQMMDPAHFQYVQIILHEASKLFLAAFLGVLLSFRRSPDKYRLNLIEAHAFLSMAGAMFMVIISGEIIRAVALLGAASIVRYRYAVSSARDASTLILSLGVGMGCGSNLMIQVTAGTILILIVGRLVAFFPEVLPFDMVNRREEMVLLIQCEDYVKTMDRIRSVFAGHDMRYVLVAYDYRVKKLSEDFVSEITLHVNMAGNINLHEITTLILEDGVLKVSWQRSQSA